MKTLIRRHIMWRLIWVYSVCSGLSNRIFRVNMVMKDSSVGNQELKSSCIQHHVLITLTFAPWLIIRKRSILNGPLIRKTADQQDIYTVPSTLFTFNSATICLLNILLIPFILLLLYSFIIRIPTNITSTVFRLFRLFPRRHLSAVGL